MKKINYIVLLFCLLVTIPVAYGQGMKVLTGKVLEKIGTQTAPSMGVNVAISNSQNRFLAGTTTNHAGEYSVRIPEDAGELNVVFSFIGMKKQVVAYKGQTRIDVTLVEDLAELGEVVVSTARVERNELGITAREQTASTQKISMEEVVESLPVASIEEALQGRMAGVDIIAGGDPGAKSSIRIRGTATLNTSADPLIVINGVPYSTDIDDTFDFATANNEDYADMLNLSPYDIESIEVLKDAASTAVYGTSGANGVLLITTKKGAKGKTRFSFSSKYSVKYEPESIPMLSGDEYVSFIQDAIWNTANAQGVSSSKALLELLFDTPEINFNPDWRYFDAYNANTDWLSYVKRNAMTSDNNFSMSGGGDKATYRFSMSYLDEGGTTVGTGLQRLTSSLNVGYHFSSKLRVDADFTFSESDKQDNWTDNVRLESMLKMPNKSPFTIDPASGLPTSNYFTRQNADEFQGAFTGSRNFHPLIMANESYNNSMQQEEKMTFRLSYDVLPGLNYSGYVSMKFKTVKNRRFLPQHATGVTIDDPYANQSTDAYSDNFALLTENKMIYRKRFNDNHTLVATGLWRTNSTQSSNYSTVVYGTAAAGLSDPVTGGSIYGRNSGNSEVRSVSGIGSVNYTWMNRYILSGTLNMEGKSSLGKSNRWGLFPAMGVAWHVQEESFMDDVDWMDQAKIRYSYGQSGAAPSGTAPYMGTFASVGKYGNNPAIAPVSIQLNNLKWQTSTEWNGGVDLAFMDNKLTTTFDYYYKFTKDLLQRKVSIPASSGYNNQGNTIAYFNSGEISNQGWEFRVESELLSNKIWRMTANFNVNRNVNSIESLPENLSESSFSLGNGRYAQKLVSGTPVGSFFGFKYDGVYQNTEETFARDRNGNVMTDLDGTPIVMKNGNYTTYPGDARYKDINYDGVINAQDVVYIGNSNPVVTGGGGFSLKYKSLTLTTFMHYRLGQKIINTARMESEAMYGTDNQSASVLKRWRNEGDDTEIPRALWKYGYNYLGSDRFVENCSFVRLKSVSLGYNLPKEFCKKIWTNSINVFVTGYDLFTWTDYTGQDPEVNLPSNLTDLAEDDAKTPRSRRMSCGITLNF
ncbi:MAG: SusC/RagA family TonB-linked outer membrane protein [Bacteroidales bacterium]|nr:SusC/RagA family TonB-linked outer membrane protein [Bacteroidales bacterium]